MLGGLFSVAIAFTTIGFHTINAAKAETVPTLRGDCDDTSRRQCLHFGGTRFLDRGTSLSHAAREGPFAFLDVGA